MQPTNSPESRSRPEANSGSAETAHRVGSTFLGTLAVVGVLLLVIAPFVNLGALRRVVFRDAPEPGKATGVNLEVYASVPEVLPPAGSSAPAEFATAAAPHVLRAVIGQREAVLTTAPMVPPPPEITPHNTKVTVHLEIVEKEMRLADGVSYTFWTFGGTVPGSFIRVREGDLVEFHLANHPNNKLPHNIDLHAVTGPGGGAAASLVAPGQQVTFTFRALNAGLYVYHCASAPVPMHVANGMYGLIFVDPFEGLPSVDHEFYFMQSEFYTVGANGEKGLQPFSQEKAVREQADYVVFNGAVGATVGDKAPVVQCGERVRLFVGNGGPNLVSSFHVIGEIFDRVYLEGGTRVNENVQTTLIPAGGSSVVEFTCETPGTLNLVDHSIFRVFNKGALGQIRVAGALDPAVYTGRQDLRDYDPAAEKLFLAPATATPESSAVAPVPAVEPKNHAERMQHGQDVYGRTCIACHGATGIGLPNVFPSLVKSDFLRARDDKGIGIVLAGLQGPVKVNGQQFNNVMPPQVLSDQEIASVLTYVHNSWGNPGGEVTPEEVAAARLEH